MEDIQSKMFRLEREREEAEAKGDYRASHYIQLRMATLAERMQDI